MKIIYILFFTHIFCYWLAVGFYTFVYKQFTKNSLIVIKNILINQFIFTPLYIIPYEYYPEPLPTYNIVWQLPMIIVLTDIIFYICHRFFHYNKFLYNHIHRTHHEYDPPVAVAALHSHPIEHLFINLLSTVTPMFIVKSNIIVSVIWTIISSVNVVIAHSGTWPDDPHTAHHKYLKYNYGVGPLLMDRLFKTYRIK